MVERCPYKAEVTGSIPVPPTNTGKGSGRGDGDRTSERGSCIILIRPFPPHLASYRTRSLTGPSFSLVRTPDCQSGGRGFKSRRPRHLFVVPCRGIEPATGGSEGGAPPSGGAYEGARDARNNERHVCARRRVGEPAGTGSHIVGPRHFPWSKTTSRVTAPHLCGADA